MTRIRVVVTAEDIAAGRPSATRCPLARAIRRATKERPVAVFDTSYLAGDRSEYRLPLTAMLWVHGFDRDRKVQPATFYLEGPDR